MSVVWTNGVGRKWAARTHGLVGDEARQVVGDGVLRLGCEIDRNNKTNTGARVCIGGGLQYPTQIHFSQKTENSRRFSSYASDKVRFSYHSRSSVMERAQPRDTMDEALFVSLTGAKTRKKTEAWVGWPVSSRNIKVAHPNLAVLQCPC
jgi:hypothetical protein